MSETLKRVLVATGLLLLVCIAGVIEHFGVHAVRWLSVFIAVGMVYEMANRLFNAKHKDVYEHGILFFCFLAWLVMLVAAAYFVGVSVPNMLLLFIIICSVSKLYLLIHS